MFIAGTRVHGVAETRCYPFNETVANGSCVMIYTAKPGFDIILIKVASSSGRHRLHNGHRAANIHLPPPL